LLSSELYVLTVAAFSSTLWIHAFGVAKSLNRQLRPSSSSLLRLPGLFQKFSHFLIGGLRKIFVELADAVEKRGHDHTDHFIDLRVNLLACFRGAHRDRDHNFGYTLFPQRSRRGPHGCAGRK